MGERMGNHIDMAASATVRAVPTWVPPGAKHYLAHTEAGHSIRALARAAGCHASTVLRQIRKVETRRDDPLVDAALRKLGSLEHPITPRAAVRPPCAATTDIPDDTTLAREALRVLRRLSEAGAVLAVAEGLERAVVVRDMAGVASARTCVVEANVAEAMALKEWIVAETRGRVIRYKITGAGRQTLEQLMKARAGQQPFDLDDDGSAPAAERSGRVRYGTAESPLCILARHRDKEGKPFLEDVLVQAGERLREDFELAQMEGVAADHWQKFLTQTGTDGFAEPMLPARATARDRVEAALNTLGPGLSDVALHCCCYLEGLESTEKRLGWSARSGKIVLRIALIRLRRFYDDMVGPGAAMIG